MMRGHAGEREVERDGGVGADHPLDRGMGDVALMPQRHVLERREGIGADETGEAGQILRQHRVPLVRHRGGALLPGGEMLFGLEQLGALQMPDLGGKPLDRARHHGERGEIGGVAVARDHLRRDRLRLEPELLRHIGFDARIDMGEGADRAGDGAGRDLLARDDEPGPAAGELGIGVSELEPEGGRLGMDAVAAADGDGVLELEGALLQRRRAGASTSAMRRSAARTS